MIFEGKECGAAALFAMYPKLFEQTEAGLTPTILCRSGSRPTEKNAFRRGEVVTFTLRVPLPRSAPFVNR